MSKVNLLPHNQLTFDLILELSKIHKRICIPQATGTGKTWLAARILEEWSDKKAIIFAPRNEILDATCKVFRENEVSAETMTYQTLNLMSDEDIINKKVDIIIFDEAHRILATEWYKKIQTLIDSHPEAMIFGLTATPVRFDGRDVREEVFENCATHFITLEEAIVRDIVQMPTYVSALYTFDEAVNDLQDAIDSSKNSDEEKAELTEQLKAAKKRLEKSMGVPAIINKYFTNYNGKYLVFCRDTAHLEESIPLVYKWFRDAGYHGKIISHKVTYNYSESEADFEAFKNCNEDGLKLLFSIEKLNEGIHIPTVDGVILLRPTYSHIIYYQQIGRCIHANAQQKPVILDLVNNIDGLKVPLQTGLMECIGIRKSGGYKECSTEFDIHNYSMIDCLYESAEVFNGIGNEIHTGTWSEEEIQILYEYYPSEGIKVKDRLPKRTKKAIFKMAHKLRLKSFIKWTDEEIDLLKTYYPILGCNNELKQLIPRKSESQIRGEAQFLGLHVIKKGIFSEEEDKLIKKYYPIEGAKMYARLKNKTIDQCRSRVAALGCLTNTYWTKKEDEIIRKYYPKEGQSVSKRLKNRTPAACCARARNLGIKREKNKYKYVRKHGNRFKVALYINGKSKQFGVYDTEEEAAAVAREKALEYGKAI